MVHLSISTPGAHIQVVRSIGAAAGEEPGLAAVGADGAPARPNRAAVAPSSATRRLTSRSHAWNRSSSCGRRRA